VKRTALDFLDSGVPALSLCNDEFLVC